MENAIVHWKVVAYASENELRFVEDRRTSRLTDLEIVTVNFSYLDRDIDPQMDLLEEAWSYVSEEISGEALREEFISLMNYHTGIGIWDIWYEGDTFYVDLLSIEWNRFNWGSTGSAYHFNRLIKTLASFPNVQNIRILIGGERDVITSHTSFIGTFHLVEGEWERLE